MNLGAFGTTGGTGLFGTPAPGSQPTGGTTGTSNLFGSSQPTNQPLFGAGAGAGTTGTGLFQQQQPQPAARGGFSFGAQTQQPQSQAGLFGSTMTQPTSSLFGSGAKPQGTSLFGSPGPAATMPGSSLFSGGAMGGASSGMGLSLQIPGSTPFGAPAGGAAANTGIGFGTTTAPQGGGLFGATGFGTSAAPQGTNIGFGPGFGWGLSGTQSQQPQSWSLQQPQVQFPPTLPTGILALFDAYSPHGPYCRFRHMLYNVVDPKTVQLYTKPPGCDEKLWQQAVENNPDASRLVPVQVSGFNELEERVTQQDGRVQQHFAVLAKIDSDLSTASTQITNLASVRLAELRRRERNLYGRLLRVLCRIERLIARNVPLSPEEVNLRNRLQAIKRQMNAPVKLRDRIADLELILEASGWKRPADREDQHAAAAGVKSTISAIDERALQGLKTYLNDELKGIESLYSELENNDRDLAVLKNGLRQSS